MENLKHGSRKLNAKVNGLVNIYGMKFHDIEGGFGEGKKAILVKEIANIHRRELRVINQAINMNRTRFTDGLDIVDLKGTEFAINLIDSGIYTQNSLNASSNIYMLSERGYSKLLKILEDDFAWEQYDKLVDGYFQMREHFNSGQVRQLTTEETLELQFKFTKEIREKVDKVDDRVTDLENRMTIETGAQKVLQDLVNDKVKAVLGGRDTPAYKELSKKTYSQCWRNFKNVLQVASYKDTPVKDFELAKRVIIDWQPNRELELMIRGCNAQMRM